VSPHVLLLAFQLRPELLEQVVRSGRVLEIAISDSDRVGPSVRLAPGPPPVLGFKILDGKMRHRIGGLDLVLDDAGH
jgi:hypothetical protein